MRLRCFLGLRSLPGEPTSARIKSSGALFGTQGAASEKKRGPKMDSFWSKCHQKSRPDHSLFGVLSPLVRSKNNSNPCAKATWTAFEKGSVSPPMSVFRFADNAPKNRWMLFFAPPVLCLFGRTWTLQGSLFGNSCFLEGTPKSSFCAPTPL